MPTGDFVRRTTMAYVAKVKNENDNVPVGHTLYGTCATAANTAAKEVVMPDFSSIVDGVTIKVKFTNSNTAANPTLNVNSTGAKNIYRYGTTAPGATADASWEAGAVLSFTYDGTNWMMNDFQNGGSGSSVSPYTSNPAMNGVASAGSSNDYARGDHVHPSDTTKLGVNDKAATAGTADKVALPTIIAGRNNLESSYSYYNNDGSSKYCYTKCWLSGYIGTSDWSATTDSDGFYTATMSNIGKALNTSFGVNVFFNPDGEKNTSILQLYVDAYNLIWGFDMAKGEAVSSITLYTKTKPSAPVKFIIEGWAVDDLTPAAS